MLVLCVHPVAKEQCFILFVVCICWFRMHWYGGSILEYGSSYGFVCCEYGFLICLPHFVEVRTLIVFIILRALVAAKSMCLL